jgi:hypothetical protein
MIFMSHGFSLSQKRLIDGQVAFDLSARSTGWSVAVNQRLSDLATVLETIVYVVTAGKLYTSGCIQSVMLRRSRSEFS